jgi:hypothetical protein
MTNLTRFEAAIRTLQGVALDAFDSAYQQSIVPRPADPPVNAPPEVEIAVKKKQAEWEAAVAKAKTQMTSSLQQFSQVEAMLSQLHTRALVDLMVSPNTALSTLVNTIGSAADQTALAELISAHAALLQTLGNIAPLTA